MFFLITKQCFKCKKIKLITDFSKQKKSKDKLQYSCKVCAGKDQREYYKNHVENYKVYRKAYYKTKQGKISHKKADLKWQKNNLKKYKASTAVNNALRAGKLFKKSCKKCGTIKDIHGHHEDYNLPLEVIWLCPSCHIRRHKEFKGE